MPNPVNGPIGGRVPGPVGYGEQAETLRTRDRRSILQKERLELTVWRTTLGTPYRLMDSLEKNDAERKQWYLKKLGKYQKQLEESATANHIPQQLLAAIILNELADITPVDVVQDHFMNSGSLGMAQIQISTVHKHHLLDGYIHTWSASTAARVLAVPQYSIEAAAREIRFQLSEMEKNPSASWPARFKFVPPTTSNSDPLQYYVEGVISGPTIKDQKDREANFARMVASAYNGGESFLKVVDPRNNAPNSFVQGANAAAIAKDLFEFRLFGSPASVPSAPKKPSGETRHKVAAGESLSSIAYYYYDDLNLWPIIHDVNQPAVGQNPNKLEIGLELVIPDISKMLPGKIADAKRRAPNWRHHK